MGKFRILIADDSEMIQKLVRSCLEEIGDFEIIEAHDGQEALTILEKSLSEGPPIQLGLLDWNMPNITGLEVLKKIMEKEDPRSPQFIMVTAEREQKNVTAAFKAGATDYIAKPFTMPFLQKKLEKFLIKKKVG